MPARPKRPMLRLKMITSAGGKKSEDMCVRGVIIA
jgi:hypothetical protein